jgi:hypothetical protein
MGGFAAPLIGAGVGLLGDALGFGDSSTQQVDPTNPRISGLQGGIADFLAGNVFGGGAGPFAGMTSDLQRQSTDAISSFLSQDPESSTMGQLNSGLLDLFASGGNVAEGIGQAALPVFDRRLQQTLGGLSSSAPGRFSTAFANQGIDFANRAAQDFALLEAQARQNQVQNQLGAAGLLGSLQGQVGNQLAQFGQLGLAQTQQAVDPLLRLMLGGMQFAAPQGMDTVVGNSPMDTAAQGASIGALLSGRRNQIPEAPGMFRIPTLPGFE